ncbi:hypothetical protein ACNOYE_07625 [Nannocystaceae bacterium ST9]
MKVRVIHLIYATAGLGAIGLGVWLTRAQQERREEQEFEQGLAELRSDARGRERKADRDRPMFFRPVGRFAARDEEVARELVFTPPPGGDPGELDAQESIDAFTEVIDELEQALEDDRKLDAEESAEFYNRANGSFKAMSAWIDASNPRERALLEDAHTQMLDLMRRLDIRPPPRQLDGFVSARDR